VTITLAAAQRMIAVNWREAFDTYKGGTVSPTPAPSSPPRATATPVVAPPPPAPTGPTVVHAGSYCSVVGAKGVTVTGKPMVCKTTATDSRLRWRAA